MPVSNCTTTYQNKCSKASSTISSANKVIHKTTEWFLNIHCQICVLTLRLTAFILLYL